MLLKLVKTFLVNGGRNIKGHGMHNVILIGNYTNPLNIVLNL